MDKKDLARRYVILFAGLVFNAFGVAFMTKAGLGASPIASIPYSLSLILPRLTIGNWTILFSMAMVVSQLVMLKEEANKAELLIQTGLAFVFGYFIDFSMLILRGFSPEAYVMRIISMLIGCVIMAFGAYLEVTADVAMLAGDGFMCAVSKVLNKNCGVVRVVSDVSMSVTAAALCLIFMRELSGVREGTIIAAFVTGNILKIFLRVLKPLSNRLVAAK